MKYLFWFNLIKMSGVEMIEKNTKMTFCMEVMGPGRHI